MSTCIYIARGSRVLGVGEDGIFRGLGGRFDLFAVPFQVEVVGALPQIPLDVHGVEEWYTIHAMSMVWNILSWYGMAEYSIVEYGMVHDSMVQYGMMTPLVWSSTARQGTALYSTAWSSTAWYSMAW